MARKTGLKGLQEWAKHVTQGYSNVEITNMTTSFRNGLAFCAIIHRYRPDLIPFNSLRKEDVLKNNQLAFTVAEDELDIPALLDAEDMVALSVPDKLSIATYLVQYYNYFKDKAPSSQVPGPKITTPPARPLGETPPAAKRTKVETIGPASVQVKATPPSPKMAAMDKKSVSSPSLGQKTTPTHTTKPHPSPVEEKGSSKEPTPEPSGQDHRVKKGRKSKFRSPSPSDGLTVTPAAPARNNAKRGSMGSENCDACGQRVFLMERLAVEGHVFHRPCFKCFTCKCLLKPGSYEFDSKGALFYCQAHYREAIRQSTLKRTMQQRGLINGDEAEKELTEAKRKKEEPQQPSSPAKAVQSPASPTREITREESQKIKVGLPSLLKSLAGNKGSEGTSTSPKHETNKVQGETKTEPEKTVNRLVVQSTAAPGKPQPPKLGNQSPKADSAAATAGKVSSEPPRRPTWSPKVQPRELTKKTAESPKVAAIESAKMATAGQPRRPTWSPKVQPRELHNAAKTTPTESAKIAATGGASPSQPPRRPTWSPKIQPRDIPKGQPESPKVSTKVGGESLRRPTWSPKIQPAEGTKSKGELPKTTLAWLAKGKEVETVRGQSSPKPLRHATVSGIPAKPSPPVTAAAIPAKPHPPVTVGQKQDLKKVVTTESIPEEPTTTKEAPPTSIDAVAGPIKPPRRKKPAGKPHPPAQEVTSPPVVEAAGGKRTGGIVTAQLERIMADAGGKRDSVIPKRPAPPRPNRPPSIKRPPLNQSEMYAVSEQRHKKRLAELRRELRSLEQQQLKLEAKGIELERKLRTKDIEADVDDHLMEEWFSLVNQKNMLVRQESDLVYELRDLELIEQHDQLEKEIRKRVAKDDSLKSELERLEEEAMINELIELVERRDQLLWALHLEKGRDEEEDKQVELIASSLHKAIS